MKILKFDLGVIHLLNGSVLRDAVISAGIILGSHKDEVDALNVYPVPDGDTGTNMSMTMSSAIQELKLLNDDISVSEVADITASSLLRGARGNSGVILSLLFRGISKGLEGLETADCLQLANALENGVTQAYKAVMNPTEGTILTVARLASQKAHDACKSTNNIPLFWKEVCSAASDALSRTPDLLPVLKKAGVVDAGGKGLLIIFEAMYDIFNGGKIPETSNINTETENKITSNAFDEFDTENIKFSYCTECLVTKTDDGKKNTQMLREYLESIGDCVLVVDDKEIIKIHVHTNTPDKVIAKALEYGYINLPKIENMKLQHNGKKQSEKSENKSSSKPVAAEKEYGFVAVAAGEGIKNLFTDAGADVVVSGGQTMNPSTNDILSAINSTPAETVFVLPNNKNIIMAAEQAMRLTERNVCVLQTKTVTQGLSAMLAFDEFANLNENRANMTTAFERTSTGMITYAVRDSEYEGHKIRKNEILALDNGKLSFTEKDLPKSVLKLAKRIIKNDTSYVMLIYGNNVNDETAEKIYSFINQKIGNKIEIASINGGQPVYDYIISAE